MLCGCAKKEIITNEEAPYEASITAEREGRVSLSLKNETTDGYTWTCKEDNPELLTVEKKNDNSYEFIGKEAGRGDVVFSYGGEGVLEGEIYSFHVAYLVEQDLSVHIVGNQVKDYKITIKESEDDTLYYRYTIKEGKMIMEVDEDSVEIEADEEMIQVFGEMQEAGGMLYTLMGLQDGKTDITLIQGEETVTISLDLIRLDSGQIEITIAEDITHLQN